MIGHEIKANGEHLLRVISPLRPVPLIVDREDCPVCRADRAKAALDSIHDALGEARESDDANLGAIVAEIIEDLKQRTIALDEANAALAEAREDAADLQATFDLQHTRLTRAIAAWQKATGREDVIPDLGALLDWLLEFQRRFGFTYCAYCGHESQADAPDSNEEIGKHIAVCPKHPMREIEAALSERTAQVATLTEALRRADKDCRGFTLDQGMRCQLCNAIEHGPGMIVHHEDCPFAALTSPPVAAMGRVIEAVRALVRQQEVIGYPRGLQYDARFHELVDTARAAGIGGEK